MTIGLMIIELGFWALIVWMLIYIFKQKHKNEDND